MLENKQVGDLQISELVSNTSQIKKYVEDYTNNEISSLDYKFLSK